MGMLKNWPGVITWESISRSFPLMDILNRDSAKTIEQKIGQTKPSETEEKSDASVLYRYAKIAFDLKQYPVNQEKSASNAVLQKFTNDIIEFKLPLNRTPRAGMAYQKFYNTVFPKNLWGRLEEVERVGSAGNMLVEFFRESVTAGGSNVQRCPEGVRITMAITIAKALDPELNTIDQGVDHTKQLRCDQL